MNENARNAQRADGVQRTNGTSRDMPSGLRACPFCHVLVSTDAPTCPSCGRLFYERFEPDTREMAQAVTGHREQVRRRHMFTVRLERVVSEVGGWFVPHKHRGDDRQATVSRGESWSVFRPAEHGGRARWNRFMPGSSGAERRAFVIAVAIMLILFIAALIGGRR